MDVGHGESQVGKKGVRHQLIIMLASMHKDVVNAIRQDTAFRGRRARCYLVVAFTNYRNDGGGLHKVGPGPNDCHDFHYVTPAQRNSDFGASAGTPPLLPERPTSTVGNSKMQELTAALHMSPSA